MIGKTINSILSNSSTLTTLIGHTSSVKKIFPYVVNENTDLPCVVYTIDSLDPEYTRGGWALDGVSFSVYSYSKDYAELQSIVSAVRSALELSSAAASGQDINKIYLAGFTEGYSLNDDYYFNRLNFKVVVNSY